MDRFLNRILRDRFRRHFLFWMCWVIGFTFIQGFGKPLEIYFGWLSYYILTLPIFVSHTYIVVYLLITNFTNKRRIALFIVLFLGFFYGFSVLELLLSNEFIFQWFQTGTEIPVDYLSPVNVIISGLGNLYILLVFLAVRTIRNWFLAEDTRKRLHQSKLQDQIETTMSRVQPLMLLYAIDHIDRMVDRLSPDVTRAIALTSELLNEVMVYHGEEHQLFIREVALIKKLSILVGLLTEKDPDVELFISGDPSRIQLPPMILFSFVDIIFRRFGDYDHFPEINIEASGFSNMITIQVLNGSSKTSQEELDECMRTIQQLQSFFSNTVQINYEPHGYGCSVIIRSQDELINDLTSVA